MTRLDPWYADVGDSALLLLALMPTQMRDGSSEPCRGGHSWPATSPRFENLTRVIDGGRRITDVPPLIEDRARPDCRRTRRWSCDVTLAIGKRDYYVRQLRDMGA